jgi:hypothetical protein
MKRKKKSNAAALDEATNQSERSGPTRVVAIPTQAHTTDRRKEGRKEGRREQP